MVSLYYKAFSFLDNSKPAYLGIYFSLFLHLFILLFAIGLPDFFKTKKISVPQVIPIEILNISDFTSLTSEKESIEIDNSKKKIVKQKKFNSSQNTEIQKIDLQEKPINKNILNNNIILQKPNLKKIPTKEKQIKKLKEAKKLKTDSVETLKVNKIKPKLKPKPLENVEIKSDLKIENKEKVSIKNKKEEKIIDNSKFNKKVDPLASILKDLRINEDMENILDDNSEKEKKAEEKEIDKAKENSEVSISEMDLVIQQLRSCFNPRAGTQIVGDEMVKISTKMDRQAKVRKDTVQIIATNISKSNPYYEAITESALATLYNPICSQLKLPLDKFESWKDLKITIDYSWIKN